MAKTLAATPTKMTATSPPAPSREQLLEELRNRERADAAEIAAKMTAARKAAEVATSARVEANRLSHEAAEAGRAEQNARFAASAEQDRLRRRIRATATSTFFTDCG